MKRQNLVGTWIGKVRFHDVQGFDDLLHPELVELRGHRRCLIEDQMGETDAKPRDGNRVKRQHRVDEH